MKTPSETLRWRILAGIHAVIGFSAMAGGATLALWPDGSAMHLPLKLLAGSPFTDYLLPGIALYGLVGVGNVIAGYLALTHQRDAQFISLAGGLALLVFVAVEIRIIQVLDPLQFIFLGLGLIVVAGSLWMTTHHPPPPRLRNA